MASIRSVVARKPMLNAAEAIKVFVTQNVMQEPGVHVRCSCVTRRRVCGRGTAAPSFYSPVYKSKSARTVENCVHKEKVLLSKCLNRRAGATAAKYLGHTSNLPLRGLQSWLLYLHPVSHCCMVGREELLTGPSMQGRMKS